MAWRHLLKILPDESIIVDELGVIRHANEGFSVLTGHQIEGLVGQSTEILASSRHPEARSAIRSEFNIVPHPQAMERNVHLMIGRRDESDVATDMTLLQFVLEGQSWIVAATGDQGSRRAERLVPDESDRNALAAKLAAAVALAEGEERFHLAFEDNLTPMTFTDLEDRIIAANDAFCQMIGRTREQILGHDSTSFTHPEDQGISEEAQKRTSHGDSGPTRFIKRYVHTNGQVMFVEESKSPARDAAGTTLSYVVSERDITEERALNSQLSHQALHDPLTGLANRALFEDRFTQAHSRVIRQGGLGAIFLLDLDAFKSVNDTHGHLVGDQLLADVARRLNQVTRSSDTLCRFGGDEFLYLAEGLTSAAQADQVATRLLNALSRPFSIAGLSLDQRVSIGVGVWDASSTDSTEVVRDADAAMYAAKSQGKGRYVVSTPGMHGEGVGRLALTQELQQAFDAGALSMHYQQIVDLVTSEVVGFEALMRWHHPERGWVHPNVFIPLAEQSDLILKLGSFALGEAVAAASTWEPTGTQTRAPYVTVNLSSRQFHDPDFISTIEETLRASNFPSERLVIEITESVALLDIPETLSVMEHLSRLGIGIALDDFGTGFASLSYLVLLHPKIIKIDQSFVSPIYESVMNDTLTEAIVTLGHKLGIVMLAEGIETSAQLERFRKLGCELGQGFIFSPAVPEDEVSTSVDRIPEN